MTSDEAIEVLENGEWWEELTEWYMVVHPEHDKLHDAVDMAISALRQQDATDSHQMTNADRIRSMSDEELAEFLFQVGYNHRWGLKEYAIEWLQMPAEEDDHA